MVQILSFYSNEIWTLGTNEIYSPYNVKYPLKFIKAAGLPLTFDNKLPVCFINEDLELSYAIINNGLEVTSKINLGISLNLWSFGYLNEKVLVFYHSGFLQCFSFTKERVVRKIKFGEIQKIVCHSCKVYLIQSGRSHEVIEWKLTTGEIKVLKSYNIPIKDITVNAKGSYLAIATEELIEIIEILSDTATFQYCDIKNATAMTWSAAGDILFLSTNKEFLKILLNQTEESDNNELKAFSLVYQELETTEIFESSGDIYLKSSGIWLKYCNDDNQLIPDPIVKIDEINIGTNKAEFKEFGLIYRDCSKSFTKLQECKNNCMLNPYEIDAMVMTDKTKSDKIPSELISKLIFVSELENNKKNYMFWKLVKEMFEKKPDDLEENAEEKPRARIKERSLQNSPGNITPTRRPAKRSVSPLNKSRKSITPQRMHKMQSDPKDIIQLAVDTSCLLSSTQNIPKETNPKLFYILESTPNLKHSVTTPADFLSSDKKALVKKLQNSSIEKDLLLSCIIAGTLGKQELSKALEVACNKLTGDTGIELNLALGSKSKAWELLAENECYEDIAYYSRLGGRNDEFFTWIITLYEEGFGFVSALHLLSFGYIGLSLQILCKIEEERLAYWLSIYLEGACKNRKEIPTEFEGWFYELGPPRFKSRIDEEIHSLRVNYEKNMNTSYSY